MAKKGLVLNDDDDDDEQLSINSTIKQRYYQLPKYLIQAYFYISNKDVKR
jgi:hypothetical protein